MGDTRGGADGEAARPRGMTICGEACTDTDPANCGECSNRCRAGGGRVVVADRAEPTHEPRGRPWDRLAHRALVKRRGASIGARKAAAGG